MLNSLVFFIKTQRQTEPESPHTTAVILNTNESTSKRQIGLLGFFGHLRSPAYLDLSAGSPSREIMQFLSFQPTCFEGQVYD